MHCKRMMSNGWWGMRIIIGTRNSAEQLWNTKVKNALKLMNSSVKKYQKRPMFGAKSSTYTTWKYTALLDHHWRPYQTASTTVRSSTWDSGKGQHSTTISILAKHSSTHYWSKPDPDLNIWTQETHTQEKSSCGDILWHSTLSVLSRGLEVVLHAYSRRIEPHVRGYLYFNSTTSTTLWARFLHCTQFSYN